jgi:hypothetical protein
MTLARPSKRYWPALPAFPWLGQYFTPQRANTPTAASACGKGPRPSRIPTPIWIKAYCRNWMVRHFGSASEAFLDASQALICGWAFHLFRGPCGRGFNGSHRAFSYLAPPARHGLPRAPSVHTRIVGRHSGNLRLRDIEAVLAALPPDGDARCQSSFSTW